MSYNSDFSRLDLPKKKEDYYSFNLKNKNFNKISDPYLHIKNKIKMDIDSYIIIKISNRNLNYNSLTISSAFFWVKPSIQIYSYKLFYFRNSINLKLDKNKVQQYKLKIIKNQDNKVEIKFKTNNDAQDSNNNNFGKQFSYPINKDFDNLGFYSNNNISLFVKFDYKRKRQNVEEINYGATTKSISKYEEFPVILYIKNINDKGLDFKILLEGENLNLNISGYLVDFQEISKIDKNKFIQDRYLLNYVNEGIYDNGAQTGIIEFNNINENIRDIDTYYIVNISLSNTNVIQNNMNLGSRIVIEAYPRENEKNMIPHGKYIRGMFDLSKNSEGKIYYIEESQNCRIFFSSNYKNLQITIDNNNNTDIFVNKSLGYLQIYIIKGRINKFTVKLINNENIANQNITANNSHININYILKYEKFEKETNSKNKRNISEKINITHQVDKDCIKGNNKYCTISFYNNPQNNNKSNNSYSSNYYLRLYKKKDKKKDEDLNTLAITSSEIYYFNKSIDNNNSEINFTLNDIHNNELYLGYLTIKPRFYTEIYVIYNFTIDIPNKEDDGKNGKNGISLLFIIIIVISSLIIIIIIIIFSIFLMRMKKKNNELEEKLKIFHLE